MSTNTVAGLCALVALVFAILNLVLAEPRKINLVGWALLLLAIALLVPSGVAFFRG